MGRRITALEVAKEAGVSRSAVSLVLNGRADGFLAKDTQERIREVADRLGYRPNLLAQSLRNQRSKVIGIMSDRAVGGAFDGAIIAGADAVAREAGFMTLAADTGGEPEKAEPVARLLSSFTVLAPTATVAPVWLNGAPGARSSSHSS